MKKIVFAILVSLALSMGERLISGTGIRRAWRLAGALILTLAILMPLMKMQRGDWVQVFDDAAAETALTEESLRKDCDRQLSAVIAGELETYIGDKAKELGLTGEVQVVLCGREEGYLPQKVMLAMPFDRQLSDWITGELGLGREYQQWQEA